MSLRCPKCDKPLPPEAINQGHSLVFCKECNESFSFDDLDDDEYEELKEAAEPPVDFNQPPKGITYEALPEGFTLHSKAGSCCASIFLIPFTIVWSGISLGGIFGSQLKSGFNPWLCLFGIPFLIGTILLVYATLYSIWGMIRLTIQGNEGTVFSGFGPFGKTKHFKLSDITKVREDQVQNDDSTTDYIVLDGGPKEVRFGNELTPERRKFFLQVLKQITKKN